MRDPAMHRAIWIVCAAILIVPPVSAQELKLRHTFEWQDKPIDAVALSADGSTLAAAMRNVDTKTWKRWTEYAVWNTATKKTIASFHGLAEGTSSMALSSDGNLLVSSTYDGKTLLWSMKQMDERNMPNLKGTLPTIAFSSDGKRMAAVTSSTIMRATYHGDNPESLPFRGRHAHRAFSPDLGLLACAFHQDIDLIDTATGKLQSVLPDHPGSVRHFTFSGDGKVIAAIISRLDENGYDSEVFVWDVAKRSIKARLTGLGWCVTVTANDDGSRLILIADKKLQAMNPELKVMDVATGMVTSTVHFERQRHPRALTSSRDGKRIAVACEDGSVRLYDLQP